MYGEWYRYDITEASGEPQHKGSLIAVDTDEEADMMIRAAVKVDSARIIGVQQTSDFMEKVLGHFAERTEKYAQILRRIINNCWKTIKYSQEYAAYLQGMMDKENFKVVSQKYASEFDRIEDDDIVHLTTFLVETLDEDLTSGDISVLLNVHPERIEKALNSNGEKEVSTS